MKSLIRKLYKKYPEMFWEVATEDMIGVIPKTIAEPANSFLKTAGRQWEQWLMWMSWRNQVRGMTDVGNKEAYLGMLFFIRWLYHLATRVPVKETPREAPKLKEEPDPYQGVKEFLSGKISKKTT